MYKALEMYFQTTLQKSYKNFQPHQEVLEGLLPCSPSDTRWDLFLTLTIQQGKKWKERETTSFNWLLILVMVMVFPRYLSVLWISFLLCLSRFTHDLNLPR